MSSNSNTEAVQTVSPLRNLAVSIAAVVEEKDKAYGASWKKRGGGGAFMMLARKWDRIENQAKLNDFNIFKAAEANSGKEGVADDLRDLVGYLLLVIDHVERPFEERQERLSEPVTKHATSSAQVPKNCPCEVCKMYSSRPLPRSAPLFSLPSGFASFIDRVNEQNKSTMFAAASAPPNSDESVLSDPIGDVAFAINAFKEGFLFARSLEGVEG